MKWITVVASVLYGLMTGCTGASSGTAVGSGRLIQIDDAIHPTVMHLRPGEEARWENQRATAVRVGVLSANVAYQIGCGRGWLGLFRDAVELVTIRPGQSISICLSGTGTVQYNVWLDPDNSRGAISRTAQIHVLVF